jgi:hypothetical protein
MRRVENLASFGSGARVNNDSFLSLTPGAVEADRTHKPWS